MLTYYLQGLRFQKTSKGLATRNTHSLKVD